MRRRSLALLAALAGAMAMAVPAHAAINKPVAVWQMNEPSSSRRMADSSGNGISGTIGSHVHVGTALSGGGTGYRFPYRQPNRPPTDPQHLVVVQHNARLNPGTGAFAVEVRLRTTHSFGNVIQKGQSASAGGYWKFEQPNGKISCLFRGSSGSSTASSGAVRVNDGRWHTVRCERTSSSVVMKVDGVVTGRNANATGSIANAKPLTIGGKLSCDQVNATCDYFVGEIDYVKIQRS
jgi:Laminin G domain